MKKAFIVAGKILRAILIFLAAAILLLIVVRLIGRTINGKAPDGGINESMYVDVNGTKQWINIYGQDKNNPVLLYLHGGPGSATSAYDNDPWAFMGFAVWGQSGTGVSGIL